MHYKTQQRMKRAKKIRSKQKRQAVEKLSVRLSVHRSSQHIYGTVIDVNNGTVLAAANTLQLPKDFTGTKTEQAVEVGKSLAKNYKTIDNKANVMIDRSGFLYHGRVKALIDSFRAETLEG